MSSKSTSRATDERRQGQGSSESVQPGGHGSKTPRRVQWSDSRNSSTHALDEQGLDPEPWETLTGALERHQSLQTSATQTASTSPITRRFSAAPRVHYFNSRPPPAPSSGARMSLPPPIDTTNDYTTRQQQQHYQQQVHPHHAVRTPPSLESENTSFEHSPKQENHQPAEIPGHYVDPHEREGLPGPADKDLDLQAREDAAHLVRAHTRGRSRRIGRVFAKSKRSQSADSRVSSEDPHRGSSYSGPRIKARDYAETDRLEEGPRDGFNRPLAGGGGLLSALLALYNEEQMLPSGVSTPASTRARSCERDRERVERVKTPPTPSPSSSPKPSSSLLSSGQNFVDELLGNRATKNSRNGGGVIGTLIASTGNLAGPASPTSSQLQPNTSRPGFHLSRYSLEHHPTIKHVLNQEASDSSRSQHAASKSLDVSGGSLEMTEVSHPTRPKSELKTSSSAPDSISDMIQITSETSGNNTSSSGTKTNPYSVGTPMSAASSTQTLTPLPPPPVATTKGSGGGGAGYKNKWSEVLSLPTPSIRSFNMYPKSGRSTPMTTPGSPDPEKEDFFSSAVSRNSDDPGRQERERRRKRKKAEIYITRHVAEIIQRQEFICKLARAMMMFGGPSHRFQAQIQATARVLDIEVSCMYLPDVMLISFDDTSTGTSQMKFIRQGSSIDLGKLNDAYELYWKVIHDQISVSDASAELGALMRKKQCYSWWQLMFFGGMCSAAICITSFNGSFIDAVAAFPMGAFLVGIQLVSVRNELYSNVFEITIATLFSFIAAALASTHSFCYSAIASGSVVLILPGFIVLSGALEIMSRNIISGSVRMCYAVVYSLFLGFGLAMGAQAYEKVTNKSIVGTTDYSCSETHKGDDWWRKTPSLWWAFLTVPMFATFLSLRNFASWKSKELLLLIVFACCGWVTNHFVGTQFPGQNDFSAAVGAFAVGFIANLWARFVGGNAFVIMITGILFQVPSGLGTGGLLGFVSAQSSGSASNVSWSSGFQAALQLISVAIGLTVGLGVALFLVHPIQSRRRAGGVFSL